MNEHRQGRPNKRNCMPEMRQLLLICVGTLSSFMLQAADFEINERSVFELQSTLKRITPTPHLVSETTATLCTSASPPLLAKEVSRSGPHTGVFVNVYVSDNAVRSMASPTRHFSEGTMILKEKLSPNGAVVAVGGMVKRRAGFDRAHNDWEYFYAEKDGALSKGRLPNCVECHSKAESADYVYTLRKADR